MSGLWMDMSWEHLMCIFLVWFFLDLGQKGCWDIFEKVSNPSSVSNTGKNISVLEININIEEILRLLPNRILLIFSPFLAPFCSVSVFIISTFNQMIRKGKQCLLLIKFSCRRNICDEHQVMREMFGVWHFYQLPSIGVWYYDRLEFIKSEGKVQKRKS